jgi:hypothetical protein
VPTDRGVGLAAAGRMSVKNMLPIIGVGSAFAILGLAAARRQSASSERAPAGPGKLQSGVFARVEPTHPAASSDLDGVPVPLTSEFWDAAPESYAVDSQTVQDYPPCPGVSGAGDETDMDGLTEEWLARATQAPAWDDANAADFNDPAEIPADSLSMISEASRHAAGFGLDDSGPESEEEQL